MENVITLLCKEEEKNEHTDDHNQLNESKYDDERYRQK